VQLNQTAVLKNITTLQCETAVYTTDYPAKRRSDDNGVVCCQRLLKLRLSTSNILILLSLAFL
jgi:hypothetical protein